MLVFAVALVVLSSSFGIYEYAQVTSLQSQNSSLSSQFASYTNHASNLTAAFQALRSHLYNLEGQNVSVALEDYAPNATVVWSGTTQGLGGTYIGTQDIGKLLQAWMGGDRNLTIVAKSLNGSRASDGTADIDASLAFSGVDHVLGEINGTVAATYLFEYQGSWVIVHEDWVFKTFNVQFGVVITTFPQWRATGAGVSNNFSESPFKNWVYYYGGASAAVLLIAYLASIPVFLYARKKMRRG